MRFVDPKNDVAFKKIFGDEQHKEILDDLEVYDYWSMKLQDERGAIRVAEQRGRYAEKIDIARTMLAEGMDSAMISKYTGLIQEEIRELMTNQE